METGRLGDVSLSRTAAKQPFTPPKHTQGGPHLLCIDAGCAGLLPSPWQPHARVVGVLFYPPLPRLGTSVRAPVGERFPPSSDLGASQQKTPPGEGPNIIASSFYSLPSQAATLSQGQAANQSQAHEDGNQEKSAQRCHFLWERRGCAITGCPITAALCLAGRGGAWKTILGVLRSSRKAPSCPVQALCQGTGDPLPCATEVPTVAMVLWWCHSWIQRVWRSPRAHSPTSGHGQFYVSDSFPGKSLWVFTES